MQGLKERVICVDTSIQSVNPYHDVQHGVTSYDDWYNLQQYYIYSNITSTAILHLHLDRLTLLVC